MRRVVPTSRFKRDLKRELKGQYRQLLLADEFNAVLETLQKDEAKFCARGKMRHWRKNTATII